MKVAGLGAPRRVRVRFQVRELDVLVCVLRDLRGHATRGASDTYARATADEAAIDDRHNELRALEGMLMRLEEQRPDDTGRVVLVGETEVVSDVVRAGAREALKRLAAGMTAIPTAAVPPPARRLWTLRRPPRPGS